ncbi:MAG: GIY-YIG nuclease family protein [Bacteroidota bacterium]
MYTVYILYAKDYNKIYIGYTSNIEQRLLSHNKLSKKGWTIKFRPWTLVHQETFESKKEAMAREKAFKGAQGRLWIRAEIIAKIL